MKEKRERKNIRKKNIKKWKKFMAWPPLIDNKKGLNALPTSSCTTFPTPL